MTPTSALSLPGDTGSVANDDVVGFDGSAYWVLFDGSDVLPATVASTTRISAFSVIGTDTVLMTFTSTVTLPGLGTVTPSDVVRFTGTLGPATSGSLSWYLDGSDVGLTTTAEAITGLDRLDDGSLVVTTAGGIGVTGIAQSDTTGSDVFRFVPTALGATTSGSWQWYLDGSDVGLGGGSLDNQAAERLSGVAVGANGDLLLTTPGSFSVSGVSGTNRDVFVRFTADGREQHLHVGRPRSTSRAAPTGSPAPSTPSRGSTSREGACHEREREPPRPPRRPSAFTARGFTRRRFLALAGGAVAVAGGVNWTGKVLTPDSVAYAAAGDPDLYLAGTDGWISLPRTPDIAPFHPDVLAPAPFTTYIFGFRNITGLTRRRRSGRRTRRSTRHRCSG